MRQTPVLVLANQKGGCGKTTFTYHYANYAAEQGKRVLVIDFDAQGSTSMLFGHPPTEDPTPHTLRTLALMKPGADVTLPRLPSNVAGIDLVPTNQELMLEGSTDLVELYKHASQAMQFLARDYDLIVVDTPPGLGTPLVLALSLATHVLVPMNLGRLESGGTQQLINTIISMKTGLNQQLDLLGMLRIKTNPRSAKERETLAALRATNKDVDSIILPYELPERAAVRQAIEAGRPVWRNARGETHRKAADEWLNACKQVAKSLK